MKTSLELIPGELAIVDYYLQDKEHHQEGIVHYCSNPYPWRLIISKSLPPNSELMGIDFLGAQTGITQIEDREGYIIYLNENVPFPYYFDRDNPEELKKLNLLREQTFGKGFNYL